MTVKYTVGLSSRSAVKAIRDVKSVGFMVCFCVVEDARKGESEDRGGPEPPDHGPVQ
jgi:hypothetical protein